MNTSVRRDLTRFLARSRPLRAAGIIALVAAAIAVALLVALQSLRTSPSQIADQTVGRFQYAIESQNAVGPHPPSEDRAITAALAAHGASDTAIGFRSFDLQVPGQSANLLFQEYDWPRQPFPQRITLLSGRWPTKAGEVVVSQTIPTRSDHSVIIRPGGAQVDVVGFAVDNFSRDAHFILAAPGTWHRLSQSWAGDSFQPVATRDILWNGDDGDDILAALAEVVKEPSDQLRSELWTREPSQPQSANLGPDEWMIAVGGPLTACAATGVYLGLFIRRIRTKLLLVGVPMSSTRAAVFSAAALTTGAGAATGTLAGITVGYLIVRPLIDALATSRPGDVQALPMSCLVIVITSLVGVIGALALVGSNKSAPRSTRQRRSPIVFTLLSIAMVILGVSVTRQSPSFDGRVAGMLVAGIGVVLLIPVIWPLLFRHAHGGGPVDLGVRRLLVDRRAGSLAATLIAATVVVGAATSTMVQSVVDDANAASESTVAPHQIQFRPATGDAHTDAAAVAAVQKRLGLAEPVRVVISDGHTTYWDGATLLVSDPAAVERLIGRRLSKQESAVLRAGGTVRTKTPDSGSVDFEAANGTTVPLTSTVMDDLDPSYRTIDGFMLQSAAEDRGISGSDPAFVFTNVADSVIAATDEAAETLGIDPRSLEVYHAPDLYTVPLATLLTALAAASLAALALLSYSSGLGRRMRPHLASLRSLGLPRTWLIRLVTTQLVGIVLVALLFGMMGGVLGAVMLLSAIGVQTTTTPWSFITVLLGMLVVTVVPATLTTTRRLRTVERLDL
ncbi:FtsX-like permease family protein [Microbacterium luticocti]|uniref:FtsX-like permease family protein n=1 Tax=Microbacterium luticocti TaxID=451764 RepID=UPI0003FDAD35|nr:FtsX-like permease family protein [Microbacterium luticocti]